MVIHKTAEFSREARKGITMSADWRTGAEFLGPTSKVRNSQEMGPEGSQGMSLASHVSLVAWGTLKE